MKTAIFFALLSALSTAPDAMAQASDGYAKAAEDAAKAAKESKLGQSKWGERIKRIHECKVKGMACAEEYEEKTRKALIDTSTRVKGVNECMTTKDPAKQNECVAAAKTKYAERKEKKAAAAAADAEKWAWDGQVGSEARLCSRGKNKPVGVVLAVTPSRVKLEINRAGSFSLKYYNVGDVDWFDRGYVGC